MAMRGGNCNDVWKKYNKYNKIINLGLIDLELIIKWGWAQMKYYSIPE